MKEKKKNQNMENQKLHFSVSHIRIHHQIIVPHQECKIGKKRKNH